jgi:hypothetical protein
MKLNSGYHLSFLVRERQTLEKFAHVDVVHVDVRQILNARVARTSVFTASNRGKLADSKSPLEL